MIKSKILKKVILTSTFTALGVCVSLGMSGCDSKSQEEEKETDTTIAFGSDIHIGASEERPVSLRSAFDTFYKMDPELDAVVFAGDLVDNGFDEEYKEYSEIVKEKRRNRPHM